MDENYAQLWQKRLSALKPQVSPDTFKRWFSAVKLVQATDDAFTFSVPNNIYQFWIESNHMAALQNAIVIAFGEPREVNFLSPSEPSGESGVEGPAAESESKSDSVRETKPSGSTPNLNPRNTFESFVV